MHLHPLPSPETAIASPQSTEPTKRRSPKMRACVSLVLLVLSTGCAFGNRKVNLSYPPQRAATTSRPSDSPAPSSTAESGVVTVVLVDFLDQRPKKTTVGDVHNGFGMHTADVIAQNSVPEWVASGVVLELEKAGFKVIRAHSIPSAAENSVISGEVLTAYCASWTKYEGDVSFAAERVNESETDSFRI